jgi:long-subunit acyl-CoA synthetase (AMP-forming)
MRSDNEKLYYFSPFEQYAEDQETGLVKTIGPDTVEIESHNKIERSAMSFSRTDKVDHSDIKQNQLKNKLKQAKKTAKKYKKTQEFKKLKKNFKEVELNKSNVLVAQYSRMATEVI